MGRNAAREKVGEPIAMGSIPETLPLSAFPPSRRFDYAEIMGRRIVWPGDEA